LNKIRVRLDTQSDIAEFVNIANTIDEDVIIEDGKNYKVNGKSLIGVMYGTSDFREIYVLSDYENLTSKFIKFVI
jgi:hypothetical protein